MAIGTGGKKKTELLFFYQKKFRASSWASELFTLDKIENGRRYYRPGDKEITGRPPVVRYFLSQRQGDFDDEATNPF